MKSNNIPQTADIPFRITFTEDDGDPLVLSACRWNVVIGGNGSPAVDVYYDGTSIESRGAIQANAEVNDGSICIYCKSSEVHFGLGKLPMSISLDVPNPHFEGGWQRFVFKTLRCLGDGVYAINTNIIIVE